MTRHLHIICHNNPYPQDYGGSFDIFNKIVELHSAGIKIHLHYFSYDNRNETDVLMRYCETVQAYPRKTGIKGISLRLPYIVASRVSEKLISQLKKDDHPILAEGIHCTGVLKHLDVKRRIIVRLHNDESAYYSQLSSSTRNIYKKTFFTNESRLLEKYQMELSQKYLYICVSKKDADTFRNKYQLEKVEFLPVFIPWKKVIGHPGKGTFCLYHGNLSVPENEKAALWLVQEIFPSSNIPLVIAGKDPSQILCRAVNNDSKIRIVPNPDHEMLVDLIQNAQVHVLPSFNATGIKLKLLNALFNGRHCVVNTAMVEGSGLGKICKIADTSTSFRSIAQESFKQDFTKEEILTRESLLAAEYDNVVNGQRLIQWIW